MSRYDAVLCDLYSGLIDSWSLWDDVAGSPDRGQAWRQEFLRIAYNEGSYRSYEDIIAEAATAAPVADTAASELIGRWGELSPWPDVPTGLETLRRQGMKLGVVTNCSDELAHRTVEAISVPFDTVATAERAGRYKPDDAPYTLALSELDAPPGNTVFVSGSGRDVPGARAVGMDAVWHNRLELPIPDGVDDVQMFERFDLLTDFLVDVSD